MRQFQISKDVARHHFLKLSVTAHLSSEREENNTDSTVVRPTSTDPIGHMQGLPKRQVISFFRNRTNAQCVYLLLGGCD